MNQRSIVAGCGAAALSITLVAPAGAPRYRAVLLEPSSEGNVLQVLDINNAGRASGVAGSGLVNPGQHAVLWTGSGALEEIDDLFDLSYGELINDAGVVAGTGHFCPPHDGACAGVIARALPGGAFEPVGTLGGDSGQVLDINGSGSFVGSWRTSGFSDHAFLHTEEDGLLDLGTLGGFWSQAKAINGAGLVVGQSYDARLRLRAFAWEKGVMTDLGALGGGWSSANDVNEAGVVVGSAQGSDLWARAFRTAPDRSLVDIQTLAGAVTSEALLVNDAGMIAGTWSDGVEERFFVHDEVRGMVDIGRLESTETLILGGPIELNEAGTLAGVSFTSLYEAVAWVWFEKTGFHRLNDLVAGPEVITINAVAGLNDAGQIAVTGFAPGSFTARAAVLAPVDAADLDADGTIGFADLIVLLGAWGPCADECLADIDGSGTVGFADLLALLAAWSA
jgi:probable HAF family extracellular repeat protein